MKLYKCHMLRGGIVEVYAYEFVKQEDDAAIFDVGRNTEYILYRVKWVEG